MQENETAPAGGEMSAEGATTSAAAEPQVENAQTEGADAADASAVEANAEGEGAPAESVSTEEITYHAVEKDGEVSAIWEMQGRKHLRTIDPRSRQGLEILRLYTAEHGE